MSFEKKEQSQQLVLDKQVSVLFQGEIGAYSQAAVYSFFGRQNVKQVIPVPTFQRVFAEIGKVGNASPDFAVVPIENTTAGSVGETCDLLIESNVRIVGETSVPIEHALMIHNQTKLENVRRVISHPQALAQCREYLDTQERGWEQVSVYDTAGAAKMISQEGLKDTAAIASELASEIYDLKVVARNIEDDHSNTTRFVIIENKERKEAQWSPSNEASEEYKTTVVFSTKHQPGALVRALSALATRGLNLDKIESRPIKNKPWEYHFYVDFEGHKNEERCREAIDDLRYQTVDLKVLGSYKRVT